MMSSFSSLPQGKITYVWLPPNGKGGWEGAPRSYGRTSINTLKEHPKKYQEKPLFVAEPLTLDTGRDGVKSRLSAYMEVLKLLDK